jgi:ribosomal protein S18 acetylase RimI-like enzyme
MAVRTATLDDLWEVARIHKARFSQPQYLLGQYSLAVIRAFYAAFLQRGILLVCDSPGGIDGFVLGGTSSVLSDCKRSFLRANALRCAWETAVRPRLWLAGVRAAVPLVFRGRKPAGPQAAGETMRMLSIAIADKPRRGGTAMSLIEAFDDRVRGLCTAYEGTVHKTNVQLLRFYDLIGMRRVADRGQEVIVRKSLVPPA